MIFNFEAAIGQALYDVDADVTYAESGDHIVKLLEIRLVSEDGESFALVPPEQLSPEVMAELKTLAAADHQERIEMSMEQLAEHGGES